MPGKKYLQPTPNPVCGFRSVLGSNGEKVLCIKPVNHEGDHNGDPRCRSVWGTGRWPYAQRCVLVAGHEGNHRGQYGNENAYDTLQALSDELGGTTRTHEKCHQLAVQWPALAAALAGVLREYGHPVPGIFRSAENALAQERANRVNRARKDGQS